MNTDPPARGPQPLEDPYDFSIVLGGPLYQMMRRSHLAGDTLDLLRRRVLFLSLLSWLPLLVLSLCEGKMRDGGVTVPFLRDVDVHVRFLIALPLLVVAELVVHMRLRPVARQFLDRHLIAPGEMAKFEAAVCSATRLRNSVLAEVLLLVFVFSVGVTIIWRTHTAVDVPGWYGTFAADKWRPSLAGWWFGLVSLPLFQFLMLRWFYRLGIWARFLWQVSRLNLQVVPTHPDHCGGLGFLGGVCFAFGPVLLAMTALLSGSIANQIFFAGAKLPDYKLEIIAIVLTLLIMTVGPLMVFIPVLSRAKRRGLRDYGTLAQDYVRGFDRKWLRGGAREGEELLGSGDIQSLADLNNSFETIRSMKVVPFGKETLIQLGVLALLPLFPLCLTLISIEELAGRLFRALF